MNLELSKLVTEQRNQNSMNIDSLGTLGMLQIMNAEDKKVAEGIENILPTIELAVDAIYSKMINGGRLIYMGAGTSGRLGVLDASECPPTFGVESNVILGLIAGGVEALLLAKEGAEDSKELAIQDLINSNLTKDDVVCGLAASGLTKYSIGGLEYANSLGCETVSICCVNNGEISKYAKFPIEAIVGPEALTGSTRLKAGSAQKMILNMISTTVMIKLGKVYQNLMVDVKPSNDKLKERAKGIIQQITECSYEEATLTLQESKYNVKIAIMMRILNETQDKAQELLTKFNGNVSLAIKTYKEDI